MSANVFCPGCGDFMSNRKARMCDACHDVAVGGTYENTGDEREGEAALAAAYLETLEQQQDADDAAAYAAGGEDEP